MLSQSELVRQCLTRHIFRYAQRRFEQSGERAGGANSGISKLGRYIDGGDRYQNDLLLSCLRLMDQEDETFGNPDWNTRPFSV